jgi:hypothetical protein
MFKAAVGHSEDTVIKDAVKEIKRQICVSLGDIAPKAGILYCCVDFDHTAVISEIRSAFPGIELIGCTTDGEFSSAQSFTEDSIVLMVFASDKIEIRAGAGKDLSKSGLDAGRDAAAAVLSGLQQNKNESKFAVILSDPLNAGVSEVSKGIGELLGETFPLIGAASSAHSKQRTTYQFCNDEILTDSVVLLLFSGPVCFSFGIQGGHSAIGGKEKITSSKKNILYTIEDKPALDYFRRYAGGNNDLFMNYCLAIFEDGAETFYVRSAPFCDPEAGTITLNGVVSEGAYIQIGTADKNVCASSCQKSIDVAADSYPGIKPAAVLHFSCAGRKRMLGTQTEQECRIAKEKWGDIPFSGFYAYGELCPLSKGRKTLFHGTTFVTLLIGEQ